MRPTIRPARPDDVEAIRAVFLEAGRTAWAHIFTPQGLGQLEPRPLPRWRDTIGASDPSRAVFVAEHANAVVGFAALRPSEDDDADPLAMGELDGLYTLPEVWGRGTGRALMEAGLAFLAAAGFGEATLWTAEENRRPRRVYERFGWRLDGATRERSLFGADFVEVRYRIDLGQCPIQR